MRTSNIENQQQTLAFQQAKEQVAALKSFYFSIMIYVLVNAGLIYIWYEFSGQGFQWFWFPILGWGLGLLFKGLAVYDSNFMFGKSWEQRKIKDFLDKKDLQVNAQPDQPKACFEAKKRVESIKGFFSHLSVYLIVNAFIVTAIVWCTNFELLSFAALSTPFFWGLA